MQWGSARRPPLWGALWLWYRAGLKVWSRRKRSSASRACSSCRTLALLFLYNSLSGLACSVKNICDAHGVFDTIQLGVKSVTKATVSCLSCMGDKLNMLVIQIHTKSQNPSLLHLTNTLLESEPQEEMQLKRYETFPKLQHLSGPMWQIGQEHQNNTISAGQSVKPWPLSGKPCWAVHNRHCMYRHVSFILKQAINTLTIPGTTLHKQPPLLCAVCTHGTVSVLC